MKIAVPTAQGSLCMHFGHCEVFTLATVDETTNTISSTEEIVPPPHEPGLLPQWLREQGVSVVIAGGMGMRAQQLFQQYEIQVVVGAPSESPKEVIGKWLKGELTTGKNYCDH
ncbi:MAG: ATPase [Chitinivibrionales bacterium]|nr:ATPase [Chitinivibrionales bacterium]MBD3358155.1 ATPase [Chitinivibrionales bacterium]